MAKSPITEEQKVEKILDNAQTLLNFCETTFPKPSDAWFASLVTCAILTADLNVPVEKFLEGFQHAYNDAMQTKMRGGKSYDH